jgi:hypothetical protein
MKTKQDVMREIFQKFRKAALDRVRPAVFARGRKMQQEVNA